MLLSLVNSKSVKAKTNDAAFCAAPAPLPVCVPLPSTCMSSYSEAVECGALSIPGDWCTTDGRFTEDRMTSGQAGKPVFGRATFYVVHSWTYRFKDLVSLLQQHYSSLPAETGWLDVYYYLDVFAVNQNLECPFMSSPDSDVAGGRATGAPG